jgi:hypothetical protein
MNRRLKRTLSRLAVILTSLIALVQAPSSVSAECTRDQAFNKMLALGRAKARFQATEGMSQRVAVLTVDIANVGKTLGDKKYGEACQRYDEIAAKYSIDLKEMQKGLIDTAAIKKDGGKGGPGGCSQADASKKMMDTVNKLQDRAALGEGDMNDISRFMNALNPYGELMSTNPTEYCKKVAEISKQFGVK